MRIYRHIAPGLICILLYSCNSNTPTIKSKTYGDDKIEKSLIFDDTEVKCDFAQVIDGSSCAANVFLYLISKSNTKLEITNIDGQMKWDENGKITSSPFLLSHIGITMINNNDMMADSSFRPSEFITEKFKTISGINNGFTYDLEFFDSTYKSIPMTVNKVIVDLEMDIKSNEKIKHYTKTLMFDEKIHISKIPSGRND